MFASVGFRSKFNMTISRLKPNTDYRFRIAATNDVGRSDFSAACDQITTKHVVVNPNLAELISTRM